MADNVVESFAGGGPKPWMPKHLNYEAVRMAYDAEADIIYLMFVSARPTTTVDNPGGIWLRIATETGEIYGVEIQGFERVFLKKHRPIAKDWLGIKESKLDALPAGVRVPFVKSILKRASLMHDYAPVPI